MTEASSKGELRFVVDARHIQQLGRELVENQVTAVTELVKNAYDADATTVVVRGYGTHRRDGVLLVVDDGVGMTLDDVSEGWMRLSSDGKERTPRSEVYGRHRAGRKGIGRFSTQTLASELSLLTTRRAEAFQTRVEFHWDRDYRAGVDLGAITNPYRRLPADPSSQGTALVMRGLQEPWTDREWTNVRDAVRLLQPPFPAISASAVATGERTDPGFRVIILPPADLSELPENPFLLIEQADSAHADEQFGRGAAARDLDDFLSAATATLTGEVGVDGIARWTVESSLLELADSTTPERRFSHVGPLKFQVSYFIYSRDALGDVKVRIASRMGTEYGGIRVYRDGLRVMPYGERDDDWLGLDELAAGRTVLPPIATSNVFGAVLITREQNPGLIDTASREGIVSGPALAELRDVLRESVIWAALRVASKRQRKPRAGGKSQPPTRTEVLDRLIGEVTAAATSVGQGDSALRDRLVEIASGLRAEAQDADREAAAREADLVGEVELLRVLASLGAASSVFSHEVSGALHRAQAAVDDVRRSIEPGPGSSESRLKTQRTTLNQLLETLAQLRELSDYVNNYTSAARRRDRREQPMARVIGDFAEAFRGLMSQRSISIETTVGPRSLRTLPMARSELEAILFNLLSNAVKALDRDTVQHRVIRVSARPTSDGSKVALTFQDSGVGVEPSIAHQIFEPFVTSSTATSPELGTGTGLGLAVVRDLLEAYGGHIYIGVPDADMSTSLELQIPRASGQLANDGATPTDA